MDTLGDMQKQLSEIIVNAKVKGYKIEDVIPKEMHDHFKEMGELQTAREFIQEIQSREHDLQADNNFLQAKLKEKEAEIDDQPADFEALKVDLQQAHRQIDYYRELGEDSQRRAQRYQRELSVAIKDQAASNELIAKLERLQNELNQQHCTIQQLLTENERAAKNFADLRAQDAKLIAANEAKVAATLSHASQVENESEQFSATFTTLIDNLESEISSAAASLNDKATLIHKTETLYNAIVSEVAPLNRFFSRAFKMLHVYQILFQSLSDPHAPDIASLPLELDPLMEGATQDLYVYNEVHRTMCEDAGIAGERARTHLNGISRSATDMLLSFEGIKADVATFLARLKKEPSTWAVMKAKFGFSGKKKGIGKRFSMG
jgi:DNA repair exonuclease SbcCD ATPase subunit